MAELTLDGAADVNAWEKETLLGLTEGNIEEGGASVAACLRDRGATSVRDFDQETSRRKDDELTSVQEVVETQTCGAGLEEKTDEGRETIVVASVGEMWAFLLEVNAKAC